MTPEQKQRAKDALQKWHSSNDDSLREYQSSEIMAALLQEMIDAPEPKPVARVTGYYAGYLSIATVDGRVLPAGTALYAAPTPAEAPADVARDAWYGSNPPSLFQATAIYMAMLESAQNPKKLSDERILELFDENATPDRWPFGFASAIEREILGENK